MAESLKPHSFGKKSIKAQSFRLIAAFFISVISTVIVSFYYITQSIQNVNQRALEFDNLAEQIAAVDDVFSQQAKHRKNLFLRGHQEKDLKKYRNQVWTRTSKIKEKLQSIYQNPLSESYTPKLKDFERNLDQLMVVYEQGLAKFTGSGDYRDGDGFVRGKGGKVGAYLSEILYQIAKDRQQIHQDAANKIETFLIRCGVLILVVMIGLSLRFISGITRPINRIMGFSQALSEKESRLENQGEDFIENLKEIDIKIERKPSSSNSSDDEISYMVDQYQHLYSKIVHLTVKQKNQDKLKAELEKAELIRQKNHELQDSLDQRNTLLRVVVHDLSNALTIIYQAAAVAQSAIKMDKLGPEKNANYWSRVLRAAETQKDIIQGCRDLAAVESGKTQTDFKPVSLLDVFNHSQFLFDLRLREKNQTLQIESDDLENVRVLADESALSNQVIANLLSNAIKFSPENEAIRVLVKENEEQVDIWIKDSGIGIPKSLLEKIFDSSAPTTRTGTSGEAGTGFGLPVVKAYMDRFEGKISVESKTKEESAEDHGTSFHLQLKKAA